MKSVLLTVATPLEIEALKCQWTPEANTPECLGIHTYDINPIFLKVDVLITGIGAVNTALSLGAHLALCKHRNKQYDLCLNIGIAGSYDARYPVGTTCQIMEDGFADMGAESLNGFKTVDELGFPLYSGLLTTPDGMLVNPQPLNLAIPGVSAITVNTVSGTQPTIDFRRQRWNKSLETMEGAAFFQAMLSYNMPFAAIRSVSNPVEIRNPRNWNIPLALAQLHLTTIMVLEQLNA